MYRPTSFRQLPDVIKNLLIINGLLLGNVYELNLTDLRSTLEGMSTNSLLQNEKNEIYSSNCKHNNQQGSKNLSAYVSLNNISK